MQGGNKVVIVVDDDAFAQQVLTTIFTGLKVEPIICADGKKAFDAYVARNGSSLAYVLMDIHMPVMDGYESTRQIRAFEKSKGLPRCKIVGLSGGNKLIFQQYMLDNDAKTKQACLDSGMDDLLVKPVKKDQLAQHL